jgi:hypothetical protein
VASILSGKDFEKTTPLMYLVDRSNLKGISCGIIIVIVRIGVITKLPNSEQSYKGKVKTHNYINRQNQSTTGKL